MNPVMPLFKCKGVTLLNVPHAQSLADEVITEDCYELEELNGSWRILDIGAFYGEFSLYAALLGHDVLAVEPSQESCKICECNRSLNGRAFLIERKFVTSRESDEKVVHWYRPDHPAGSGPQVDGGVMERVSPVTVKTLISMLSVFPPKPLMVKMDCEGAEVEICKTIDDWIDQVDCIAMEFHNRNAAYFAELFEKFGFSVKATGSGPKPRAIADSTTGGGLIIARRKQSNNAPLK